MKNNKEKASFSDNNAKFNKNNIKDSNYNDLTKNFNPEFKYKKQNEKNDLINNKNFKNYE